MPIIQYVLPSKNKQLKKLLHFYWEVCKKKDDHGKLRQEMILVWYAVFSIRFILWYSSFTFSNAIRNDLVSVAISKMVPVLQFRTAPPQRIHPRGYSTILGEDQGTRAPGATYSNVQILPGA
jgi:hypothetical protein